MKAVDNKQMLLKGQTDTEMMVWITNLIIPIENNFIELNQKEFEYLI